MRMYDKWTRMILDFVFINSNTESNIMRVIFCGLNITKVMKSD